jgi:hypothetical protein
MGRLTKVISGGQTGVDQAALRAAQDCGLETGGWCPPGRVCESGVIPARFALRETPADRRPDAPDVPRSQRTEWNVRDADATLILRAGQRGGGADPGTEWAERCAGRFGKPVLVCGVAEPGAAERIARWVEEHGVQALGAGGPSEGTAPGIGDRAYALLAEVFRTSTSRTPG